MANLFQKIGQKLKDAALGAYHQVYTGDNGQTARSYMEEEERRRRQQQQEAAARAQQQIASRTNAPQQPGSLQVEKPHSQPRLSISQPNTQPKTNLKVAAPAATPTIKVPQVTPPKVPLPDQQFIGVSEGAGKNKTLFGWNAAFIIPKGHEKVYEVKANRTVSTNKDKFVAQFDNLNPEYQKILVNGAKEKAKAGDQAAINTLKALEETGRMKGSAMDFVEGSNERLYGGLARGGLRIADFALPGKNTFGLERLADQQDPNKTGTRQFTQRGKQGEIAGTVQKGIVDLAAIAVPGGAADKGVEAVKRANDARKLLSYAQKLGMSADEATMLFNSGAKVAQNVPKYKQFLAYVAKVAPGSLVGTGVDALQTKGRGDDVNIAKSAGIGLALDVALPVALKPFAKYVAKYGGKVIKKGIGLLDDAITPKASAAGLADEATDVVDHSLTFSNIRDRVKLPEPEGLRLAGQEAPEALPTTQIANDVRTPEQISTADRAAEALAAGDDTALRSAQDEFDRLSGGYIETPIAPSTPPVFTQTADNVPQPSRTAPEGLVPDRGGVSGGTVARAAENADTAPILKVDEPNVSTAVLDKPTPDIPPVTDAPTPRTVEDRVQSLEQQMIENPTPEVESALREAQREVAGRQAAVQSNSVAATANQELVDMGLVQPDIHYTKSSSLKIGSDSMDDVDPSTVQDYINDIRAGRPIDPIIISRGEDGQMYVQDGKHRLQALKQLGVENAPVSIQGKGEAMLAAPQGEVANNVTSVAPGESIPNADGGKPRGFAETVKNSDKTADEVAAGIDSKYDPITNEESLRQADEIIARDPEGAVQRAKTEQGYSREIQAVSMRLIDELQTAGRYGDAIDVIEATAARATEAGQATQILAAYNRLTPEGILQAAQREVTNAQKLNPEKYKNLSIDEATAQKLRTMAEDLQKLPAGSAERKLATRELLNEISRVVPTPGTRKFVTIWKAGLLTGIKGAVGGNTVSNAAAAVVRKIADVPASMIDAALAKATGQRSKVFTLKGLFGGFGEGLKVGVKNFKEGVGAEDQAIKLDHKKVNFGTGRAGRAAQKYTDSVINFYSASDRPFYHAALNNSLQDLARVEARNAGLTGKPARDFVDQMVKEPTDDVLTTAVAAAEEATNQAANPLRNALSGAKRGLASKGGAGELVGEVLMPFTGVPAAIAKQVYDYSPAGAATNIYQAIKASSAGNFDQAMQRKLSEALGRGLTGTGVMWIGSELHKDGIMTLGFPTDPKERALWESEGKTPYSVKIGGKWRSMNYMGSLMSLMAIGGQVNSAAQEGSGLGSIPQGIAASGKAIIGSTPLQGLQGGLDAVTEPERYGEKFVNNTVGSIIPTLVKDVAVANDPLQRQVTNPIEAIQNRLPGARNSLEAKVDVFGNDMPRATGAIASIIDPFKSSQGRETDVTREMRRLQDAEFGISPPKIDKSATFDGVKTELDPAAITDLTKRTNLKVQEAWSQTMATPEYQALSDEDKSKALASISGDIAAAERVRYAGEKKLGQFAPDADTNGNKPTRLSGKQDSLLQGGFDPTNYTSGAGERIAKDVSTNSRETLTKVNALTSEKRTEYMKDPKNNYYYELAKYENDLRGNKLSDVEQYEKIQDLGKLKVKSNYSKEAIELYGLSKTKLNDFIAKKGGVSQKVLDEVMTMDQQLANEGFIKKPKFASGIGKGSGGKSGGGGTIKVPLPNFGSFKLVEAPKTPAPTMQSVLADMNRMFGDIKILQGLQIAPGDDSSKIQITV